MYVGGVGGDGGGFVFDFIFSLRFDLINVIEVKKSLYLCNGTFDYFLMIEHGHLLRRLKICFSHEWYMP